MLGRKLVKTKDIERLEREINSLEMFILLHTEITDNKGRCGTSAKRVEVEDKFKRFEKILEELRKRLREL